jgi:hypothetical protein
MHEFFFFLLTKKNSKLFLLKKKRRRRSGALTLRMDGVRGLVRPGMDGVGGGRRLSWAEELHMRERERERELKRELERERERRCIPCGGRSWCGGRR